MVSYLKYDFNEYELNIDSSKFLDYRMRHDEIKYSAEEKIVEDTESEEEDVTIKKTVAERRQQIEKRLSVERQIPASTQKKEIVEEITTIKRQSLIEDKKAIHEEEIMLQKPIDNIIKTVILPEPVIKLKTTTTKDTTEISKTEFDNELKTKFKATTNKESFDYDSEILDEQKPKSVIDIEEKLKDIINTNDIKESKMTKISEQVKILDDQSTVQTTRTIEETRNVVGFTENIVKEKIELEKLANEKDEILERYTKETTIEYEKGIDHLTARTSSIEPETDSIDIKSKIIASTNKTIKEALITVDPILQEKLQTQKEKIECSTKLVDEIIEDAQNKCNQIKSIEETTNISSNTTITPVTIATANVPIVHDRHVAIDDETFSKQVNESLKSINDDSYDNFSEKSKTTKSGM